MSFNKFRRISFENEMCTADSKYRFHTNFSSSLVHIYICVPKRGFQNSNPCIASIG